MADEAVFTLADLSAVIERGAATLVNVKLAKAGGLAPARDQLVLAAAHGIGTMVGSMMETGVGVAAAGSLVAAVGTTLVGDLDAAWWLADGAAPVSYDRACCASPTPPGWGGSGDRRRRPAGRRLGRGRFPRACHPGAAGEPALVLGERGGLGPGRTALQPGPDPRGYLGWVRARHLRAEPPHGPGRAGRSAG